MLRHPGRRAPENRKTVELISISELRGHGPALGRAALTGPAVKMTMQVISVVADSERAYAGMARAKASGR